jgi:hypothetical protein
MFEASTKPLLPQVDVRAPQSDEQTALHTLAHSRRYDSRSSRDDQEALVRAMRLLVAAGVRLSCAGQQALAQSLADGKQFLALRWLSDEVGAAVLLAKPEWLGHLLPDDAERRECEAERREWEAICEGQRRWFRAAGLVLQRAATGDPSGAEKAAAQAEGGAGRLLCCAVDEHGRRLMAAAGGLHPAALAWARGWEERLLAAWAMASHSRLGALSPAGGLGDEVVRWIGELVTASAVH